jgi:acyl-CoA thioesterase-2
VSADPTASPREGDEAVQNFLSVLEVEQLEPDLFRAWNPPVPVNRFQQTLFGGQVAAHALRAAIATVDQPHVPHSFHGYFLRPGKNDAPSMLRVDRIRDGKSFTTRTVVALQDDEPIFSLTASFHKDEPGGDFVTPIASDVPLPDQIPAEPDQMAELWGDSPFERVEVPEYSHIRMSPQPRRAMWIKLRSRLPDDPSLHACILTFLSDMGVLAAVRTAHGPWDRVGMAASLDHAVWFHRPGRADEWLLFDVSAKSGFGSRGLGIGTLHALDGTHVATISQEGLVRLG